MKVVTLIQHHNVHTLEAQKGTPHLPNEQQQTLANFKYQCPIDFMLILRILWAFLLFFVSSVRRRRWNISPVLRDEKQFAIFDHWSTYIYHTGVFS